MIVDLHDSHAGDLPKVDVAIVGSGPAGMTLARELSETGLSVCVLESGRLKTSRFGDALRKVVSQGAVTIKDYSRERVLGGASSTWAGLSAPLDSLVLNPRSELGIPGWPLKREELETYWKRAASDYRFAPMKLYEPGGFEALREASEQQLSWKVLQEKVFLAAAEPQHFGKEHKHIFEKSGTDLYLDATLLRLEGAVEKAPGKDDLHQVSTGVVRSADGSERKLSARVFVLATGGLENARILLASQDICAAGLGNEHDQVGRCLMNHPKNYCGIIRLSRPVRDMPYLFGCLHKGYAGYAGLRLSDAEQQRRGLLNAYVRFEPLFPWSDKQGVEALVLLVKRSTRLFGAWKKRSHDKLVTLRDYSETGDDSDFQNARKGFLDWLGLLGTIVVNAPSVTRYVVSRFSSKAPLVRRVRVRNFLEMEPHPDNRVTLGGKLDPLGQPETVVSHGPTKRDKDSLRAVHQVLADELAENGFGSLESDLETAEPWPIDLDASHHLGTTRMGTDPLSSVTDACGRLHSVSNVYLAGGSLFPTSGCANPTLTIVALAIRQADKLKELLLGGSRSSGHDPEVDTGASLTVGQSARRRVLVIGAGERVNTDVLPALRSLPDRYEVLDIFARSRRPLAGGVTHTRDFRSLTDEDVLTADLAYIAVSKGAVPEVLKRLAEHPSGHLDVLIDTPVLMFKHLGHARLFEGFRNTWVAEDCSTLPWLDTVKEARARWLGPLSSVTFDRSAYRYHGFAMLKTLFDGEALKTARKRRVDGGAQFTLHFMNGAQGVLLEPRDYVRGCWHMTGRGGGLTDANGVRPGEQRLELVIDGNLCTGFRIGEIQTALTSEESALLGDVEDDDTVTTRMEELKRVGLRRLLVNVADGRGAYDLWNGLDDMLVEWALDKTGRYAATRFTSMLQPSARSFLGSVLRLLGR